MSRRLAALGAVVIDSDLLAREAVAPGTSGLARVVEIFGPRVLSSDGSLDRAALGAVVFADPARRGALEAVVHPYVRRRSEQLAASAPPGSVVVHDVPLLVEKDMQAGYDVVVVVDASDEVRLHRLVEQRGMSEVDALARLSAQASRERRLAAADVVIANDGDLAELDRAVVGLWSRLAELSEGGRTVEE